jgi:hypothetical protein
VVMHISHTTDRYQSALISIYLYFSKILKISKIVNTYECKSKNDIKILVLGKFVWLFTYMKTLN